MLLRRHLPRYLLRRRPSKAGKRKHNDKERHSDNHGDPAIGTMLRHKGALPTGQQTRSVHGVNLSPSCWDTVSLHELARHGHFRIGYACAPLRCRGH